jgi:hypothetical protein
VTKRTRAPKRATNHFILNWNKMFERCGWRATKRARATAARATATGGDEGVRRRRGRLRGRQRWWASDGDNGRRQRAMARAARVIATAKRGRVKEGDAEGGKSDGDGNESG